MHSLWKKPIIFGIFISLFLLPFCTAASPDVQIPFTLVIPAGLKVHFGDQWVSTTSTDMHITSWFSSSWVNYTVDGPGTQEICQGTRPGQVWVDGVQKTTSGWTYSGTTSTVNSAVSSVAIYWGNLVPTAGTLAASIATGFFDSPFVLSVIINDDNGNTDFKNCSLDVNGMVLGWVSSDVFTEVSDVQDYMQLSGGSRSEINVTAYSLSWTLYIRNSYAAQAISLTSTVFDNSDASGSASASNVMQIAASNPPQPGIVTPIIPENPLIPLPENPLVTPVGEGYQFPIRVSLGTFLFIVVIVIVAVSAYSKSPLKSASKRWRKGKKGKKVKWEEKQPWS
jgi:hypothetical protein